MRKYKIPQNFTLSLFFLFGLGIGFASLAHPCLGFLCKKQERCRVFLVLFSVCFEVGIGFALLAHPFCGFGSPAKSGGLSKKFSQSIEEKL